jgi:hypothetical protein
MWRVLCRNGCAPGAWCRLGPACFGIAASTACTWLQAHCHLCTIAVCSILLKDGCCLHALTCPCTLLPRHTNESSEPTQAMPLYQKWRTGVSATGCDPPPYMQLQC